jgi:hypothetical protein
MVSVGGSARVSKDKKPNWTRLGIIATIVSAVVSVAGACVSIWAARNALLHDQLSMKPLVEFMLVGVPVEDWSQPGIHLVNYGNGVALIESLTVYVDSKPVQPAEHSAGLEEAARVLGLLDRADLQVTYAKSVSQALPAGQTRLLIGMEKDVYTPERGAVLNGALKHVGIRVMYKSLYGDAYEAVLTQP